MAPRHHREGNPNRSTTRTRNKIALLLLYICAYVRMYVGCAYVEGSADSICA
jgi:hypothetical protein